jgi:hypothetical protein
MDEVVSGQYELWRTVERNAKLIVEVAGRMDTVNIDSYYTKMTAACIDCHANFVKDGREPLNPLPWRYRSR